MDVVIILDLINEVPAPNGVIDFCPKNGQEGKNFSERSSRVGNVSILSNQGILKANEHPPTGLPDFTNQNGKNIPKWPQK
jgi:hypothetical protein